MKRRTGIFLMAIGLITVTVPGYTSGPKHVIEISNKGNINWTLGIVQTYGIGKPVISDPSKSEDKKSETISNARDNAIKNSMNILKKIRVNSKKRVKNLIDDNNMIEIKIREMLDKAQEIEKMRKYMADGSVRLYLQVKLHGGFAQLILPEEIKHIESIKHINPVKGIVPPVDTKNIQIVYTGLVLDARGISAKPAMAPKIYDEKGEEVYGAAYISREFAVQNGTGLYVADAKAASNNPRVGINPLYIKALRTQEPGNCDFIISNADAHKLHYASEHLLFLKKCGLMIILD